MLDIFSRAVNFWSYQQNQEMSHPKLGRSDSRAYQEYLLKSLQDKYNAINNQLESLIRESNTEITRSTLLFLGL